MTTTTYTDDATITAIKSYARRILGPGRWGVRRETGVEGKSGIWSVWGPGHKGIGAQSKQMAVWAHGTDVRPASE